MTGRATFKKSDVQRAVSAVKAAGCEVARVDIGLDGKIQVTTTAGLALTGDAEGETLDRELQEHRRGHGYGAV